MASHETELFKDKIEVSLDGRQIFYLFFGGAIIATLVFVLGVMVGRRVEGRAVADNASTVSDPLAALDRLEAGSELAFPAALRGDDVSLGEVDATLAKREALVPRPGVGGPVLTPDPKAKEPSHEAKVEPKAKDEPEVAAGSEVESAPKPVEIVVPKKAHRKFTLQVGSFQDKEEADRFFKELVAAKYKPYMVEASVPGKGTYYRVRIGGYTSFDAAVTAKSEFEDNRHIIAYVTRLQK